MNTQSACASTHPATKVATRGSRTRQAAGSFGAPICVRRESSVALCEHLLGEVASRKSPRWQIAQGRRFYEASVTDVGAARGKCAAFDPPGCRRWLADEY